MFKILLKLKEPPDLKTLPSEYKNLHISLTLIPIKNKISERATIERSQDRRLFDETKEGICEIIKMNEDQSIKNLNIQELITDSLNSDNTELKNYSLRE